MLSRPASDQHALQVMASLSWMVLESHMLCGKWLLAEAGLTTTSASSCSGLAAQT